MKHLGETTPQGSRTLAIRRVTATMVAAVFPWVVISAAEFASVERAAFTESLQLAGLLGPVILFGSLMSGLVAWIIEPWSTWGLPRIVLALKAGRVAPQRLAACFALTSWSLVVSVLTIGGVAVRLLDIAPSSQGRALLGGATLLLGAGLSWLVSFGTSRLSERVGALGWAVFGALAWGLIAVLIAVGETSGAGGVTKMWGVFRREELHLALPLYAVLVAAAGYQLPVFLKRLSGWTAAVVVGSLGGLWVMSSSLSDQYALALEQEAPLAGVVIRGYQRLFDADHDGFSKRFGGGDCDDGAADVNPDARDLPGNDIDEDCSGKDAVPQSAAETREVRTLDVPNSESSPSPPARPKDLNVVLITVDTMRYDLGFTGYARPVSPNIDALAKRSTVYERAYSLASYTSKSLGPMLIGRYGSETHRGWMHFNKYPVEDLMLHERLKAHGVFTLSVQGHWYFKADTGLGRGFDILDLSAAPDRPQGEGDKTVNSKQISDAAVALLSNPERNSQRFYMWVHYLDPHAEYVAHEGFDFGSNSRARYDGELAFTDSQVGRVIEAIGNAPYADRTVIIVTSDHGEAFGEHGLVRHGFELWEELVRVPLLVYVPGQSARQVKERRSAIDLAPTLLELFGIAVPVGDDALSGRSLLGEWYGAKPAVRDVFIDMPAGPYNGDRQSFITGDLKLTTSNGRPMSLFNLSNDPGEATNLAQDVTLTAPLLERMQQFRSQLKTVKVKPR